MFCQSNNKMASRKLLQLAIAVLIIEVLHVHAQCNARVEFINQPSAMPTISTTSYVQPVSQFVIPAVIKPIIQSDSCIAMPPNVPDYSNFYNSVNPSAAMPPIIFDSGSNSDGFDNLLYFILFALRNRRNGGFGRGGNNGGCSCGGFCNNCGGGNRSCGCGNYNSCQNCGGCLNCGNCGNFGNNGGCGKCGGSGNSGGCSCGSGNGNNGNISFPCGSNCIYIPFPIAVPIGNGFQFGSGSGCPVIETSFGGCDDSQSSNQNGSCPNNEINLIIRTDQ